MKWNDTTKEVISHITAEFLILFGVFLVIYGFLTPPVGEVHGSVQLLFGQTLVFAGAVFGISLHFDNKSKTMMAVLESKMNETIHKEVKHEVEEHFHEETQE